MQLYPCHCFRINLRRLGRTNFMPNHHLISNHFGLPHLGLSSFLLALPNFRLPVRHGDARVGGQHGVQRVHCPHGVHRLHHPHDTGKRKAPSLVPPPERAEYLEKDSNEEDEDLQGSTCTSRPSVLRRISPNALVHAVEFHGFPDVSTLLCSCGCLFTTLCSASAVRRVTTYKPQEP
jgi:hypothetical protein